MYYSKLYAVSTGTLNELYLIKFYNSLNKLKIEILSNIQKNFEKIEKYFNCMCINYIFTSKRINQYHLYKPKSV